MDAVGQIYVARDGLLRPPIQTNQEYRLAANPISQLQTDASKFPIVADVLRTNNARSSSSNIVARSTYWWGSLLANVSKAGMFFLTQCNLIRALWA